MNLNTNYPLGRGRTSDLNHWYSSNYWRSNSRKLNNSGLPSVADKVIALDNLNVVHSIGHEFGQNVRPYTQHNSRVDSRQSVKRSHDFNEKTKNEKRIRAGDPFQSPDSRVRDFRLLESHNSADSDENLRCQSCHTQCQSLLDYSNHLSGRRHKTTLDSNDRPKQSDAYKQLVRLLKQTKDSIVGLDSIKEMNTRNDFFECLLCRCYDMTVNNTIQHIKGYRHQRNFMAQERDSEVMKRSAEREKRQTEKRSISSSTQTCDHSIGEERNRTSKRMATPSNAISSDSCLKETNKNQIIPESDSEKLDSCKKTIENFRTIREICDQMIRYFAEKQKSFTNMSPKNRSLTSKTFECLSSQIKKEK